MIGYAEAKRPPRRAETDWGEVVVRSPGKLISQSLQRQGFLPSHEFIVRFIGRLRARRMRFDIETFADEFYTACHYRQPRSPFGARVAVIKGIPIFYRHEIGGDKRIALTGILPASDTVCVVPIRPPRPEIEALLEEEFELFAVPAKKKAKNPAPRLIRKFQRPAPRIVIGEIKPDSPTGLRAGRADLNKRANFKGNEALVTYDKNGFVTMRVYKPTGTGVPFWQGVVGQVSPPNMPAGTHFGSPDFGNAIEEHVRRIVAAATGQKFRNKHASASGPDLSPI